MCVCVCVMSVFLGLCCSVFVGVCVRAYVHVQFNLGLGTDNFALGALLSPMFPQILAMIEEAAGTRMYESKRAAAQKTIEKKDSKLKEIETVRPGEGFSPEGHTGTICHLCAFMCSVT